MTNGISSICSDPLLKNRLFDLLYQRAHPKTACPSEIPRALSLSELADLGASHWRDLMPTMRELVFRLRDEGQVEVLQRGEVVGRERGLEEVRGPVRVRLVREEQF
ncbi:hypothetical protein EV356DRAFT_508792 [Viridothelium virens]|uniref:DUF3253 domain-containing protein n=1 Tax=Viridothelium virens TaxID=1048519 RepID=A0A6A6HJY6_VIRVR|nr:hypothetical protein EV356DRAFT_508792 [Viridothelium virens]